MLVMDECGLKIKPFEQLVPGINSEACVPGSTLAAWQEQTLCLINTLAWGSQSIFRPNLVGYQQSAV